MTEDCQQDGEEVTKLDGMSQRRTRDFSGVRRSRDQKVVLGSKLSSSPTSWPVAVGSCVNEQPAVERLQHTGGVNHSRM